MRESSLRFIEDMTCAWNALVSARVKGYYSPVWHYPPTDLKASLDREFLEFSVTSQIAGLDHVVKLAGLDKRGAISTIGAALRLISNSIIDRYSIGIGDIWREARLICEWEEK